ncbi:Smr/MutS family protein [Jejudonia soesokkakensis]|uniref:Smr/MutS family protein n=1 Tax=Jejudonia soesokkakensis TaxID=1323432 RepID=A0ABW2MX92_9FLAO
MKIGDMVSVLDEVLSGTVIAIDLGTITIETEDGFELTYAENELVIIDDSITKRDMTPSNIKTIISEKQIKKKPKSTRIKPKDRKLPPMEVDLHIHQLTANEKGMHPHDKLSLQVDTAKRQIDFAISKKIQRVVFIHGVGEGVLRAELEYLFRRYDNITYNDADYKKYGRGATEIYIFQNKPN